MPEGPVPAPEGPAPQLSGRPPVRLLAVPDSAPPYDDDAQSARGDSASQVVPRVPTLALAHRDGAAPRPGGTAQAGNTARAGNTAQAAAWPGRFAQVLAETLAGSRSQGQIMPWTNVAARRRIRQLGPLLTAGAAPRVRRVVTTEPAAGVVEMTVIVGFGDRVRAIAVRLERDRACPAGPRWLCTAVEAA